MGALRTALRSAAASCLVLGVATASLVAVVRAAGWLEPFELPAYDWTVRVAAQPDDAAPIALIDETEEDLRRWGFPMSDERLAQLLAAVLEHAPAAVGVDKYRDVPVPPGDAALERLLRADRRVVWIAKFGGDDSGVLAPPALRGSERVGFNDLVDDPGGIVRRGLLFVDDGKQSHTSFALLLALQYLEPRGIGIGPGRQNADWVRLGEADIPAFGPNDGGYSGADAAGYQFLIDFVRAPRRLPTYTVTDVLEGRVPPGALKGKIVVYGASAVSLRDYFYTPFSQGLGAGQRMSGFELQGVVVAQLVRIGLGERALVRSLPEAMEYAILFALGALAGLLGYRGHAAFWYVGAVGGGLAAIAATSLFAMAQQLWLPLIPWSATYVAAAALSVSYRAYRERQDRSVLMQIFSRHISRSVAESLWQQRDEFMDGRRARPQQLTATVLFTDIRGFTAVSERLTPAQLVEWLNEYMEGMAAAVNANGGVVNKYIGDAVMALFGVPLARTSDTDIRNDALSAVHCALQMCRQLEALNRRFAERGLPPVGIRAGIFTGPLVAGSIGASERLEYTVIGDTVNTASRLESYKLDGDAAGCRILIGEPTWLLVRDAVPAERIGELELRGKEAKVTVYRVKEGGAA